MKSTNKKSHLKTLALSLTTAMVIVVGCVAVQKQSEKPAAGLTSSSDAAQKVYVEPGKHDELYAFMSGGFSGQVGVYGLPSGRLLKVIPVFSQNAENGYGYSE